MSGIPKISYNGDEMSKQQKYVARAEAGVGWRIWNRRTKRSWGNFFPQYPEVVLQELNGLARPEALTELCKSSHPKKKAKVKK